jgi:phosphatidate cytidylyltransferase
VALSNLATRVLFAVVAVPVVIAAIWVGGDALAVLLSIASAIAAWEFCRLAVNAGYSPFTRAATIAAGLLPLAVRGYSEGKFVPPVLALGAMAVLATLVAALFARGAERRPLSAAAVTVFAVLYTGGMLSFAYALRTHGYIIDARAGTALLLYPLLLTWTTDIAAFFVGRSMGRRKLMPSVSPAKTVAGAVGGLAAAMLVSWAYVRWVLVTQASLGMAPWIALAVGAAIGIAAQAGDLVESMLKREAGVKDSSRIIPGHGGVLDRLDSLLFAIPLTYFLFTFPHVLIPVVR